MLVNMFLGILSGIFILQTVLKNLEPRLPISCVWEVASRGKSSNAILSLVGTIAVIAAQVIVFVLSTWYLHSRSNPHWLRSVQVVGLLTLLAMGVGATVRVIMESQAFGNPPASVNLTGPSEGSWSFGQLLPLLLLVLPFMNLLEIARGEMRMSQSRLNDDNVPLYTRDMDFEPHPLAGSTSRFFKR